MGWVLESPSGSEKTANIKKKKKLRKSFLLENGTGPR